MHRGLSRSLVAILIASLAGAQEPRSDWSARRLVPASDSTETRTEVRLHELGRTLVDVRRPGADGRVLRTTIDAIDGSPVDLDGLRRRNHSRARARRGKLHASLWQELAEVEPAARLEVAFWLADEASASRAPARRHAALRDLPPALHAEAARALRSERLLLEEERLAPRVEAFAESLTAAGAEVLVRGLGWPLVIARVEAGAVRELAADPRVETAYRAQPEWFPEGDIAQGTMRTSLLFDRGLSADGSVKVLVNDVGQVQSTNPYLPPIIELNSASVGWHATGVAGNIANDHTWYRAAGAGLTELYSGAGASDADAPVVWNLALAAGVDLGNCSWQNGSKGSIEFLDRFFDHTIRAYGVMMFKSNGNEGATGTPYGTTPGQGYNMVSSGSFADGLNSQWSGDAMSGTSSWLDPVQGHTKPELASPGAGVTTTGTSLGGLQSGFAGTSSASPLTCGVAALLASQDGRLLAQMTTLKAVLMVSAWHNLEGDPVLSDRDGAGGVHAAAAHAVVEDERWRYEVVESTDFPGGVRDVTIPLLRGQDARVIALWLSSADSSYSTDVLDMDLDLVVLDPSGAPVASSASATDAFELVGFTAPVTGDYTVRLTLQRFDGESEPLTVAWSTRDDTATARIELLDGPGDPPFAVGQAPRLRLSDRWNAYGNDYVLWAAVTPPKGIPLPGGFTAPTGFDGLSKWSLTLPGFVGPFSFFGDAVVEFPILPDPAVAGIPIRFGLVVLDFFDTVVAVSDEASFVIR